MWRKNDPARLFYLRFAYRAIYVLFVGVFPGGRMDNLLIGLFWAVCGIVWVLMHMDMAWLDSSFCIGFDSVRKKSNNSILLSRISTNN